MMVAMVDVDLDERLARACEIAREAGDLALDLRSQGLAIEAKGRQDFVTQADRDVEALVAERLAASYPSDGFLGEENGLVAGENGTWVVDPIDGTSNYMNGIDHWSVSIAYMVRDRPVLGCVFAPDRNELFEGARGGGSRLNGVDLHLKPTDPEGIMFGLGASNRVPFSRYLELLDRLNKNGIEHRRFGSAALSITDVAAGRLDGYFELHVNIWDVAAALIIAQEAQADTVGFEDPSSIKNGDWIYAAAPGLRDAIEWGIFD